MVWPPFKMAIDSESVARIGPPILLAKLPIHIALNLVSVGFSRVRESFRHLN